MIGVIGYMGFEIKRKPREQLEQVIKEQFGTLMRPFPKNEEAYNLYLLLRETHINYLLAAIDEYVTECLKDKEALKNDN